MHRLAPWQQKTVAIALLGAIVALALVGLIAPFTHTWQGHTAWRASTLRDLRQARGLLEQRAQYEQLASTFTQSPTDARLWTSTPDVATAAFETELRQLIEAAHATLQNVQPLAAHADERLPRISVEVQLTATIDQLTALLDQLARAPQLLTMDRVLVAAPDYQDPTSNAPLTVRLRISGYLAPPKVAS
jgi:Tfp pilus assembly protein PilO